MQIPHELIALARRFAHGSVSIKSDTMLSITAVGRALPAVEPEDFILVSRSEVKNAAERDNPLNALVALGDDTGGALLPGIETALHAEIDSKVIVHVRSTPILGLLSARGSENAVRTVFNDDHIWVPALPPDREFLEAFKRAIGDYRKEKAVPAPRFVAMANRGLLVCGADVENVQASIERVLANVEARIERRPGTGSTEYDPDRLVNLADAVKRAIAGARAARGAALDPPEVTTFSNDELLFRTDSTKRFEAIRSALTADQLIHLGSRVCYVSPQTEVNSPQALLADVLHEILAFFDAEGTVPRIVAVRGAGAVAIGRSEGDLVGIRDSFVEALETACYAESFGGAKPLPDEFLTQFHGEPAIH